MVFFNLFQEISQIKYFRKIRIQTGKNDWDIELCRKRLEKNILLKLQVNFIKKIPFGMSINYKMILINTVHYHNPVYVVPLYFTKER